MGARGVVTEEWERENHWDYYLCVSAMSKSLDEVQRVISASRIASILVRGCGAIRTALAEPALAATPAAALSTRRHVHALHPKMRSHGTEPWRHAAKLPAAKLPTAKLPTAKLPTAKLPKHVILGVHRVVFGVIFSGASSIEFGVETPFGVIVSIANCVEMSVATIRSSELRLSFGR